MFYEPKNGHGLPHNPFNAIISPRPIAWVSSRSADGVENLAPYSFFNAVAYVPPQVMFANTGRKPDQPGGGKDTVANIIATGEFCINIVETAALHAMNTSSQGFDKSVNEFTASGVEPAPCHTINCARVAHAPAALECKLTQVVTLPGDANLAVFGEVTGIHMRDDCVVDGLFDVTKFKPLARMGYRDYTTAGHVFELARPDDK